MPAEFHESKLIQTSVTADYIESVHAFQETMHHDPEGMKSLKERDQNRAEQSVNPDIRAMSNRELALINTASALDFATHKDQLGAKVMFIEANDCYKKAELDAPDFHAQNSLGVAIKQLETITFDSPYKNLKHK